MHAFLCFLLFCFFPIMNGVQANSGGGIPLEHMEISVDPLVLQKGAKYFVNHCMGCHSLSAIRYQQLADFGLDTQDIKRFLILDKNTKTTDFMITSLNPKDAKEWFGIVPPDLSLITRVRGVNWVYTYLRSYYPCFDCSTGWDNLIYPKTAMPHVLSYYQGARSLTHIEWVHKEGESSSSKILKRSTLFSPYSPIEVTTEDSDYLGGEEWVFSLPTSGQLTPEEYADMVGSLVSFLDYVAEPYKLDRISLGFFVISALLVLLVLSFFLKREYWKDIH